MNDFEFSLPTKVHFGKGKIDQIGNYVKGNGNKILIHYGSDRIKKNGLYQKVIELLKNQDIEFLEFGGAEPNPSLTKCKEGIRLCRDNNIDFILAIGGGSVIDSAKAISLGVNYSGDVWDFFTNKSTPETALPLGVILTIPATASETNSTAVITNKEIHSKRHIKNDLVKPVFAVMDPEVTYSLPPYQTAVGCIDIMAHVWERYFVEQPQSYLLDKMFEAVIKTIIQYAPIALRDPKNYKARSEIMWASSIAHNDMLGSAGDFASHSIGNQISALYNLAHGGSLAIAMIAWAKYVYKNDINRFCQFAENIWGIEQNYIDPENAAYQGIMATEDFFNSLGIPTKLSDADIPTDQFELMADQAVNNDLGYIGFGFKRLYKEDIIEIYKLSI